LLDGRHAGNEAEEVSGSVVKEKVHSNVIEYFIGRFSEVLSDGRHVGNEVEEVSERKSSQ
jgi:hypothetical protein